MPRPSGVRERRGHTAGATVNDAIETVTFHLQFSSGLRGEGAWRRIGLATAGTETASLRVSFAAAAPVRVRLSGGLGLEEARAAQ